MTIKVFALGATGYIGGDALYAIIRAHPEYEVTCLVRNSDKGVLVAKLFPRAKLVYGDLDSFALIEEECCKADVVCHWANADHEGSANAIIKGIRARDPSSPGFYIHTSGTGILTIDDMQMGNFGLAGTKIYDDWGGLKEVTTIPDAAPHRNVDKIVLAAGSKQDSLVRTAIVCPPTIYGVGRGPDNQRSIQVPLLVEFTFKEAHGVVVGEGKALWTEIHVHDLSNLFVLLVEEAARGGGAATWGPEGYYFCESAEFAWGDIAREVAKTSYDKKYIQTSDTVSYSPSKIDALHPRASHLWGRNSRCRSIRARKALGWSPKAKTLKEEISEAVDIEARRMGIVKPHADVAAGLENS